MPPPTVDRRTVLASAGLATAALLTPAPAGGQPADSRWRVPRDTREHTRTWMGWPDRVDVWGRRLLPGVQRDIARIARAISRFEPVVMLANGPSAEHARRACGPAVTVIDSIPLDDCWLRDTGPVFRVDGRGGLDAFGTSFNGWGGRQAHDHDALVAERIASFVGVDFSVAGFVGEGGAVETDGAGTLMATESSLVNDNRNPGRTRQQIARALERAYGADKVVWFTGVRNRDITDDHVDATSRFLRAGRALTQLPPADERGVWARDARQQYRRLSRAETPTGTPIKAHRLGGPDYGRIRSQRRGFLASYANFYVCNGAVIVAQFGHRSADVAAQATLARHFPDREIVALNVDSLASGGGGIHCVTQQQPAVRLAPSWGDG